MCKYIYHSLIFCLGEGPKVERVFFYFLLMEMIITIFAFAMSGNIHHLCDAQTIFVDGTFQICPRLFYQIFTLLAFKQGKQFPLVYMFLSNKRREIYEKAFNLVKS